MRKKKAPSNSCLPKMLLPQLYARKCVTSTKSVVLDLLSLSAIEKQLIQINLHPVILGQKGALKTTNGKMLGFIYCISCGENFSYWTNIDGQECFKDLYHVVKCATRQTNFLICSRFLVWLLFRFLLTLIMRLFIGHGIVGNPLPPFFFKKRSSHNQAFSTLDES